MNCAIFFLDYKDFRYLNLDLSHVLLKTRNFDSKLLNILITHLTANPLINNFYSANLRAISAFIASSSKIYGVPFFSKTFVHHYILINITIK
jgi:hypothetical protein